MQCAFWPTISSFMTWSGFAVMRNFFQLQGSILLLTWATVTTDHHLQLLDRSTKQPPVLIGPMLLHQRKTTQSYHFLASSMVGLCPDLVSIQAFGTDGEKALSDAFQLQFRNATHLQCFLHVKDSIVRKLRDIGICGDAAKPYIYDIFGIQEQTHLYSGLVGCNLSSEFDEQLLKLKDKWNEMECSIRSTTCPMFLIGL